MMKMSNMTKVLVLPKGIDLEKFENKNITFYEIIITKGEAYPLFKWGEVEYDIIPFLIQLNNDFKIDIEVNGDALDIIYQHGSKGYSMDEVSDKNTNFDELNDVSIYL